MTTITATTATEAQAEIANKLNRNAREIGDLLGKIQRVSLGAMEQMAAGFQVNMDISRIASCAADLAAEQKQQTLLIDMAYLVELPQETIHYAVTATERIWFRPATVAEVMGSETV